MKQKLRRAPALLFIAALVSCAGCDGGGSLIGRELSAFDLQPITTDARPVSVADLKGKVTLINFWATWCGPCVREFPHLLRIVDAHQGNDGFLFLSAATGHPTVEAIRSETEEFMKARGYSFPAYADVAGRTQNALPGDAASAVPVTLLLDRDAKIANAVVGFNPSKLDEIDLQIASLLKQP